jgi:hypothetical protein
LSSPFDNGVFTHTLRYQLPLNREENLKLKLQFPVENLIGLHSITIRTIGRSTTDSRDSVSLTMRGSEILMLQRDSRLSGEIYIDGAHLTPFGNALVADRLVKILTADNP